MSSRSRDRSDRSSHRRDSSPRRRRRSESPPAGPSRRERDEKELPPSFGPGENRRDTVDDNLNVLQRMQNITGPLELLMEAIANQKELKIWTRNYKEIRGILTGKLLAFDKHWNLVLQGVQEVFLKRKKTKTPFLREITKGEDIPDLPPRVPRKKASASASAEQPTTTNVEQPSTSAPNGGPEKVKESEDKKGDKDGDKKKKKRKKTRKPAKASDREYGVLFVRGDNIVMIAYKDE